ncbi:2-nitroimidazole transporter [Lactiplantibacillus plantarum subsp. plantarum]|uniref:2-nitroimidazole transporter n=1 Tax=Lactiplantibacillus plantarum subsp. plantarum TaxID=337330 RepID=A0A2S3U2X8_LACPN|nr:2-nitroimidazole transporter [Lactiplantibacillus plantarum subsp. plantarum]
MTASDGQSTATHGSVWRRPLAWVVTAFFGLQALVYYSLLTWLPTVFVAHGFSLIVAGNLVTVMQLSGLPMSYLVPATSGHRRGVWANDYGGRCRFYCGNWWYLTFRNEFLGGSTVLRLTRIRLWSSLQFGSRLLYAKTTNGFETADLSGMAQSAGYLLAAVGPVLFGWLGGQLGWGPVLWLAIILSALLALSGSIIFQHATIYE